MQTPDFDAYTEAELRQVLTRIDAVKHPERVRYIEARLAAMSATPSGASDALSPVTIAGFWRRLGAFLIDMLILGTVGVVLGWLFHDRLAALGQWGRAVGFFVALAYFGIMESRSGKGGSLGKRVLGLQVVTRTGAMLSPPAAFCRAALFCLAYFLNGISWKVMPGQEWINVAESMVIGILVIGVFYLLLFNRRTRQSLHDLAVGAFVIKTGTGAFALPARPVWRGHYAIAGGAVLVLLTGGLILQKQATLAALMATQQAISALPDIDRVTVTANVLASNGATTRRLLIGGVVDASFGNPDALAATMANIALDTYPDAKTQQQIVVTLTSGYDIGIASDWRWTSYAWTPRQWRGLAQKPAI
jgi:uncharacterized RDD family membrane protein YckC